MSKPSRREVLSLLAGVPAVALAQPRAGLLTGAPDPTAVAVTNAAGERTYFVAATGRGVRLLRSRDLVRWEPAGRVFEADVPDWASQAATQPGHGRPIRGSVGLLGGVSRVPAMPRKERTR